MNSPVFAASYLARAQALYKTNDKASLNYAALELRCGVEARLQAHAAVAHGISKTQAEHWEIKKLSRTLDEAFGLGDSLLIVLVTMNDGRACQFMYAPVSTRLQEIAKRCGDYLRAIHPDRVDKTEFWTKLRSMVEEGCHLLNLACSSEILRPTVDTGIHFQLAPEDHRVSIVRDFLAGVACEFSTVKITPTSPFTIYPANSV